MKKIFLLFAFLLCFVNANSADLEPKKTFIVGFDPAFPPYGYKDDNGEFIGFDLDLAQQVATRNGWELIKQPIDWDSKDFELNSNSIDCIWNGFTMNGREDAYTWSVPYVDNSQVVIVRNDSDIKELKDLKNKVVVVQADSSALAAFKGANASKENKILASSFKALEQVNDYNTAFLSLESGAADAICLDIGVAKYQLDARGSEFRMLSAAISSEQYAIGFKLGNTELRDKVEKTLFEMLDDGSFAKTAKTWGLEDSVSLNQSALKTQNQNFNNQAQSTNIWSQLAFGMLKSLQIFFLTLIFSLPLGLLICAIRQSKIRALRYAASVYISVLRGTPLMLQLLVVFFGPYYLFGISLSSEYRFYAVIIGFCLNYAAYFAEIFRAGFNAVPKEQSQAAFLLGYSSAQTYWRILFPQMCNKVIPPVTNEVITLVKDTSLAFVLAYAEMFSIAKQIAAAQASLMPLFVAGLFYYIFNFIVAWAMAVLEKKVNYLNKRSV